MLCGTVPPSDCRFIDNQVLHFLSALFLLSSFIDWRDVPICVVSGSFEQGVMGASVSHHIDEVQGQRSRTFFIWSTWHILALLACYHQFSLAKFLTKQNMLGIALSLCSYPCLPPRTFPILFFLLASLILCASHTGVILLSTLVNPICTFPVPLVAFHERISWTTLQAPHWGELHLLFCIHLVHWAFKLSRKYLSACYWGLLHNSMR